MARLLRERSGDPELPIALRGSSMGGYFAIAAAETAGAAAVVAICPASASGMRRGLADERFEFEADVPALDALFAAHDEAGALDALDIPVLLLHAEGDEVVPVQLSRELATHLRHPRSRLIALPGGHHRSIQHDHELQAVSLRFIEQALARGGARVAPWQPPPSRPPRTFPAEFSVDAAAPVAPVTVLPTAWPALRTVLPSVGLTFDTPLASVAGDRRHGGADADPALATVLRSRAGRGLNGAAEAAAGHRVPPPEPLPLPPPEPLPLAPLIRPPEPVPPPRAGGSAARGRAAGRARRHRCARAGAGR